MDLDIDGTVILYGVSALFGAIAALYFGQTFLFGLSGATKSMLLFLGFTAFILAGRKTEKDVLDIVLYILATASYLSFFLYTVLTFDLSRDHVFIFLGLSSILFAVLAYLIREDRLDPGTIDTRTTAATLLGIAVLLIAIDFAGPQVAYDISFEDELELEEGMTIGTITAHNRHIIPREVEVPAHQACIDINGTREFSRIRAENLPETLMGGQKATSDLTARVGIRVDRQTGERPDIGPIQIQQAQKCPDDRSQDRITIVEGDDLIEGPAFD